MKRTNWIAVGIGAALMVLTGGSFLAQQSKTQSVKEEVALRAAMEKETVQGDLKGAIEQYKKLAQGSNRAIAAQALLHMAECYQKLGDAQAQKIYERIVREYADQKDAAERAQAQLGASPSSLSPNDDDLAAERDAVRSIIEGPRGRTPGDLSTAVFIADITPDGHARGPVVTLLQEPGIWFWAPAWSPDGETIQAKRKSPGLPRENLWVYSMTKREARLVGGGPPQPNPWFHNSLNLLGSDDTLPIVNIRDLSQEFGKPFLRMDFPVASNLMALSPDDKTLYLVPRPVLHGKEGTAAGMLGISPGELKNNKVIIVDISTRKEKQRLTLPVEDSVRELALSPDGRTLAMWTVPCGWRKRTVHRPQGEGPAIH